MATLIGIDPGEKTGFAVWDGASKKFLEVSTLPLWKAMEEVKRWYNEALASSEPTHFWVFFEDARQRTWFPKEKDLSEYRGKLMGAGAAKRDAKIWEEYLTALGIPFTALKPRAGLTKWSADYWQKMTGWKGRTSEHARDAALLVWGRK